MSTNGTSWRDVIAVHAAAELFPRPTDEELRQLSEDILQNGLLNPPVIWSEPAEPGEPGKVKSEKRYFLVDGISRLDAMEAAGIPFELRRAKRSKGERGEWSLALPVDYDFPGGALPHPKVIDKADAGDPYALAVALNIHRRHLTAEQKRELIAELLKADPSRSDRQIAETVKASPTTVGVVRTEMEAKGDVSTLDTRRDTKGRKQPATKKPRQLRIPGAVPAKPRKQLAPPAPPKPPAREDIGPNSLGEAERLRARNEELANEAHRLRHELKAAERDDDPGSIDIDNLCARITTAAAGLEPADRRAFLERLKATIADLEDDLPAILPNGNGSDHEPDGADDLAIPTFLRRSAS